MIIKFWEKIIFYRNNQQCYQININKLLKPIEYYHIAQFNIGFSVSPNTGQGNSGVRFFAAPQVLDVSTQALLAWIELLVGDRFLFLYWMHTLIWYSITLGQNWLIDPNLSKIWSNLGCVHTQMTQRNWTMSIVESPAASGWPQMPQFRPPVLSSRRPPWNRRHRRFNKNTHCGVMVSKKCEWCHSRRLISWVAWQ